VPAPCQEAGKIARPIFKTSETTEFAGEKSQYKAQSQNSQDNRQSYNYSLIFPLYIFDKLKFETLYFTMRWLQNSLLPAQLSWA